MDTINIQIPCFAGFYETIFDFRYACDIQSEIDYYEDEYGIVFSEDDFVYNEKEYSWEVSDKFAYKMGDYLKSIGIVNRIDNVKLVRPQFYNFLNDRIFADVTFADGFEDKLKDFIAANWNDLSERIADDYGKLGSNLSADLDDWVSACFTEGEYQSVYLFKLLEYYLDFDENFDLWEIESSVLEEINSTEYVFPNEDAERRITHRNNN